MAAKSAKTPETEEPKVPATPSTQESEYSVEELIANFKAFKTSRALVTVALRKSGKKSATFAEAKIIVDNFKNKEVK